MAAGALKVSASFERVAPERIEIENNHAARENVRPRRTETENNYAATRCTKIRKKYHLFLKNEGLESVSEEPSKSFRLGFPSGLAQLDA